MQWRVVAVRGWGTGVWQSNNYCNKETGVFVLERTLLWRRGGFCVNNMNMDHLCSRGRKSIKIHNVEQIFLCNSTTGVGKFEIFTSLKFCLLLVLVRRFVQFLTFWDYTFRKK